jgi:multiple sugar transport system permease protein
MGDIVDKDMATPGRARASGASWWSRIGEKERFMLLLVAPAATMLVLFQIVPIFIGANASFRDWTLYDPQKTWIGWKHYAYVLTDPVFMGLVLPNTFLFMFLSVAVSLVLGLALAHLLNREFFGRWVVQTAVLLPLMLAPVIASTMMRWVFNDQFGVVAAFIEWLGFGQIAWLAERWPSFFIVLFTDAWIWTPWFTLLLLAGLKSLPREPYEAAAIDAAGPWRVFTHITLPMLRPVMLVCIVIRAIDAFRTFDQVWVITAGGPARGTELFSVYAYIEAFQNLNFGRGSAAAVTGGVIILVVGMIMYKMLARLMDVSR